MNNKNIISLVALLTPLPVFADAFIDDAQTSVRYAQYYWNEDPDDGVGPTRDEWVHALQVGFQSGYFGDLLALNMTAALAGDLNIGADANNVTNLNADDSLQDPDGIGKLTEAYIKLKGYQQGDNQLLLGLGKKVRNRMQYKDNTTRILPTSTTGLDIDYSFRDGSVYFTQIEGFSPRNGSTFAEDLRTFTGEQIDYLRLMGASYNFNKNTRVGIEYAESDDYLKSYQVALSHMILLGEKENLNLKLQYGQQKDAGGLFEYAGAGPFSAEDGHDARFYELGARYSRGPYYVGLSMTEVSGDDYDRTFFAQDYGTWDSSAKNFYWFGLEDERMFKLSAGMSFADLGLPALRWDAHYAYSTDAAGFNDFDRDELQSVLQYRFSGALEGLHLAWLHVEHNTDGTPDGVKRTAAKYSNAGLITHHADRLYLNYSVKF